MIVSPIGALHGSRQLLMITQNDHAHFAAEIMGLWHRDGLRDHPRRDSLLFAARQHDNGWFEVDAAPPTDEDGRPHDFMSIPRPLRQEIWQRSTSRYADRDAYGNLLIVQHALHLHRSHVEDADWAETMTTWRDQRRESLAEHGFEMAELEADYRWIDLTDLLSLLVCNRWQEPVERHGYRARLLDGTLQLAPFPLVGSTSFRIPCRRIDDRPYAGVVDLGGELAMARWQELEIKVSPWTEI